MNHLSLLLGPDTQPAVDDCQALLLLASHVTYYQSLADDPTPAGLAGLSAAGLCQGRTPVDLGEHTPRFRQLLQELGRTGGDFYRGSLAALARANEPHAEEAAVWSLIATMRQQGNRAPEAEQELETVWNALLLLKLAEQYLAEEREVAAELAAVSQKEAALFEELKGDEEFAAQLAAMEAEEEAAASRLDRDKVTRAWGQLFLRDETEFPLLALSHPGPALLLLDLAAALSDTQPVALLTLPVPLLAEAEFAKAHAQWQKEEAAMLAELRGLLLTFAREGSVAPEQCNALGQQWETAYQRHFAGKPQRLLTISALPGTSLGALFTRLTRSRNKKGQGAYPHGLIVHLAEPV